MRVCAGFVPEVRPGCQGLHRQKTQGLAWGVPDQRPDTASPAPQHAKVHAGNFAVSAKANAAAPLVREDDLFLFESEGDMEESRQLRRKPKSDDLISAEYGFPSLGNGRQGGLLKSSLKRSTPVGIPSGRKQGLIADGSTTTFVGAEQAPHLRSKSQPIAIPKFSASLDDRINQKERNEFVPPHIYSLQMNNVEIFPHSVRPLSGQSALRQRTVVLAETGYLDGYTEMGQRPQKHHGRRHKNAFSA